MQPGPFGLLRTAIVGFVVLGFSLAAHAVPDGTVDSSNAYSMGVRIDYAGSPTCSGVVLEPRVVATAAHCFKQREVKKFSVHYVDGEGEKSADVDRVEVRSGVELSSPGVVLHLDDVALLRLDDSLPVARRFYVLPFAVAIEPRLSQSFRVNDDGLEALLVGFGSTRWCDRARAFKDCPMGERTYKTVSIRPFYRCCPHCPGSYYLEDMVCFSSGREHPTMYGDSGGGLFLRAKSGALVLVGIVSQGPVNVDERLGFFDEKAANLGKNLWSLKYMPPKSMIFDFDAPPSADSEPAREASRASAPQRRAPEPPAQRQTYSIRENVSLGVQNMRTGPGVRYSLVVGVPAGAGGVTIGSCVAPDDRSSRHPWCRAQWRGHSGWISSCCLVPE